MLHFKCDFCSFPQVRHASPGEHTVQIWPRVFCQGDCRVSKASSLPTPPYIMRPGKVPPREVALGKDKEGVRNGISYL